MTSTHQTQAPRIRTGGLARADIGAGPAQALGRHAAAGRGSTNRCVNLDSLAISQHGHVAHEALRVRDVPLFDREDIGLPEPMNPPKIADDTVTNRARQNEVRPRSTKPTRAEAKLNHRADRTVQPIPIGKSCVSRAIAIDGIRRSPSMIDAKSTEARSPFRPSTRNATPFHSDPLKSPPFGTTD